MVDILVKEVPLKGDEVVGGRLPDPNVAEHLICVGAEVKVGGVGAGDAVALPLLVGGRGGGRLAEVHRPPGGDRQLPLLTILPLLLMLPLIPSVNILQDGSRDPSKVCLHGKQVCDAVQVSEAVCVNWLGLWFSLDGNWQAVHGLLLYLLASVHPRAAPLGVELTVVPLLVTLILALTPTLKPVIDLGVSVPVERVLLPAALRGGAGGGGGHLGWWSELLGADGHSLPSTLLEFLVDCHSQLQAIIGNSRGKTLDPGGEDSLVVEDGVADAEAVEVVVLDARSHAEPGLEATRPGLQESRLRKGNVGQQGGKEGIG